MIEEKNFNDKKIYASPRTIYKTDVVFFNFVCCFLVDDLHLRKSSMPSVGDFP